jgi:hypothetical protein
MKAGTSCPAPFLYLGEVTGFDFSIHGCDRKSVGISLYLLVQALRIVKKAGIQMPPSQPGSTGVGAKTPESGDRPQISLRCPLGSSK